MTVIENDHSSADNLNAIDWVQQQTQEELNKLTNDWRKNSFYEIKEDWNVMFSMDLVKQYLKSIKDKSWWELKEKNSWAWIIAVQIALESMWYDVGKIDWVFWGKTKEQVRKFQNANWLKADWFPWKDTINKICDVLDWKWWSWNWNNWSHENGDTWNRNYTIEKIWNKKVKVKSINSVSELPDGYKWGDPENYDESNEDTYPTTYSLIVDGKNYRFYSNGRCATPEWMKDTKDVVERLRTNSWSEEETTSNSWESWEYEWNLANGFWNTLQSHMEEKFKDLLKLSDNTEIKMSSYKTISFRLSPMQVIWNWWDSVVPQVTMDPRKFLTEDWSAFADERIQNIIIPDILKKLSDKKKTIVAYNALKWKKYDRKAIFSDTEFNALGPNDQQLVKNYFNYFDDGTLEFNYDTPTDTAYDISGDRANLKLRLDDDNGDEDWNKRNNNSNLIFSWSEIVNDDFKLNEDNLKWKLRDIILKAIKREDFK